MENRETQIVNMIVKGVKIYLKKKKKSVNIIANIKDLSADKKTKDSGIQNKLLYNIKNKDQTLLFSDINI